MSEPTWPWCAPARDAASLIFNLPGYEVIDAVDLPLGGRRVVVQANESEGLCPSCGTASSRVHAWSRQRVKDVTAGAEVVEVVVKKPRWVCAEQACSKKTFTQVTEQLPARARCLTRLREALLEAVVSAGRAVDEIAAAHQVAWWTVQTVINAATLTLPNVDDIKVTEIGVDEHRFARVRFFRDADGGWKRVEPWMSTIVNTQTGQVLGVVTGRGSAGILAWFQARPQAWLDQVQVVAIDPSAAFRAALRQALPHARISVDHWHLIRLANLMVTGVRQRVAREQLGRRGRKNDLAWAHRLLLLRGGDQLSERAWARLEHVLHHDDPTNEIGAAWGVKERLRMLLACPDLTAADTARGMLGIAVAAADMDETWRLWDTVNAWWDEIETFIETRVTNARTEAANTSIKHIKRTGRGYRNHDHYRARILLRSARQTRRRSPLNQQATTFNCG